MHVRETIRSMSTHRVGAVGKRHVTRLWEHRVASLWHARRIVWMWSVKVSWWSAIRHGLHAMLEVMVSIWAHQGLTRAGRILLHFILNFECMAYLFRVNLFRQSKILEIYLQCFASILPVLVFLSRPQAGALENVLVINDYVIVDDVFVVDFLALTLVTRTFVFVKGQLIIVRVTLIS